MVAVTGSGAELLTGFQNTREDLLPASKIVRQLRGSRANAESQDIFVDIELSSMMRAGDAFRRIGRSEKPEEAGNHLLIKREVFRARVSAGSKRHCRRPSFAASPARFCARQLGIVRGHWILRWPPPQIELGAGRRSASCQRLPHHRADFLASVHSRSEAFLPS